MRRNVNLYQCKGDYTELSIYNSKGELTLVTKIDNDDVDLISKYSFRTNNNGYVKTSINNKSIYLHRLILDYYGKCDVDHINNDKTDNRKANLRICSHSDNCKNRIAINQNIRKVKRNLSKPYMVRVNNKFYGYYKTYEEALDISNKVKQDVYGEYACL